jgi:nucleoside-diphosphate-sugar epimerase
MKKSYKTILVGNSGFLGRSFLESNHNILSVGRTKLEDSYCNHHISIADWSNFTPLDNIDFENVIFLIGSSDHDLINKQTVLAIEKNVFPLMSFLDYLLTRNDLPKKIVTFTTMLQYDTQKLALPCNERSPIYPYYNKYVFSKYLAEHVSEYYRKYFQIIDIRLSNVYGPTILRRPDIVPSLIWSLLENDTTYVRTKIPIRDFVFVGDVIESVNSLLLTTFSGPINIGSGVGSSINYLCNILEDLSDKKIIDLKEAHTGHLEYYHDLSLLNNFINYIPKTLESGLQITYNRMKKYNLEKKSF